MQSTLYDLGLLSNDKIEKERLFGKIKKTQRYVYESRNLVMSLLTKDNSSFTDFVVPGRSEMLGSV